MELDDFRLFLRSYGAQFMMFLISIFNYDIAASGLLSLFSIIFVSSGNLKR